MFKYLFYFLSMILVLLGTTNLSYSADDQQDGSQKPPKIERVGGKYLVKSIDRTEEQDGNSVFVVVFESETPTGKYDLLRLESDHIHVGISPGQKLRLSAEILETKGNSAEVGQVLLFLPERSGPVPIWLLSRKNTHRDLNAAKFIEMHAPQSDFRVF